MATPLTIEKDRRDDGTVVVRASGELDMSNIDAFSTALNDALGTAPQDDAVLTIDLSSVDYLDSGAINELFSHAQSIQLIVNPILMSVLSVSGLTEVTTVEEARQAQQ